MFADFSDTQLRELFLQNRFALYILKINVTAVNSLGYIPLEISIITYLLDSASNLIFIVNLP